jgi:hypothetical protein
MPRYWDDLSVMQKFLSIKSKLLSRNVEIHEVFVFEMFTDSRVATRHSSFNPVCAGIEDGGGDTRNDNSLQVRKILHTVDL